MRALLLRVLAAFIVLVGLVCLAFPFVELALPGGPMLLDDTRGFFGAGTGEGVPVVHQVTCSRQRYGGSGGTTRRGVPTITEYRCDLLLSRDPADKKEDPYAGLRYEEAMKAYAERIRALDRGEGTFPDRIERTFARDVSGEPPPHLRLLSPEGVSPPRYAVLFDGSELAWRWGHWFVTSLLVWAFAAGCFFGARAGLRRARGEAPF